ncbi:hypothetical protein [Dokdonella immobilis]|uniref:hypothetical protein n=1 Tax=Dokdonella immobilis TaxID=578942 RepID=UPI001587A06B|nr:hypothetical protein [Dokdonella immobilis]
MAHTLTSTRSGQLQVDDRKSDHAGVVSRRIHGQDGLSTAQPELLPGWSPGVPGAAIA